MTNSLFATGLKLEGLESEIGWYILPNFLQRFALHDSKSAGPTQDSPNKNSSLTRPWSCFDYFLRQSNPLRSITSLLNSSPINIILFKGLTEASISGKSLFLSNF